jgi:hypothetical protein
MSVSLTDDLTSKHIDILTFSILKFQKVGAHEFWFGAMQAFGD